MKLLYAFFIFSQVVIANAQDHGFPFGKFLYKELQMKEYEKDTSAQAVVLNEFGEAYFQSDGDFNLVFEHHFKIKILKTGALDEANIEIPLHKNGDDIEKLLSVKASAFNIVNNSGVESKLDLHNVFTENRKYHDIKKFAIPNVKVGSVIDVMYEIESPFIFNFHTWNFQSNLPKVRSEYWATIPGNYIYNITLKGFLKMLSNDAEVLKDCFSPNGEKADCARYKFIMQDIPAFVEEEYMTAPGNFISAINFELSEIRRFDGVVKKYTEEWKDVDEKLRRDDQFGIQIKRGKDIVDEQIELAIAGETDPLIKAKKIYDFIQDRYLWNEAYGKYSDLGIKKAFNEKKGNVADINLSLIAALKYADLSVEPLILSTRENGLPIDIHPVLSDFNYVIAKLNIGEKVYLLDATDDFVPFGMLPVRCLNGKGRALGEKESYWYDIKPADKRKKIVMMNLKLEQDGYLRGTLQSTFIGYEAVSQRKTIASFTNQNEYIKTIGKDWHGITIQNFKVENVDDINKPLIEKLDVEMEGFNDMNKNTFFFNPFFNNRLEKNPFKSTERFYPVDFGTPLEYITILTIELPDYLELEELPTKVALALPNAGGRYIFDVQRNGNKLVLNNSLLISRSIFSSEEYHYLRELYNRIIQLQNADLVFTRKDKK